MPDPRFYTADELKAMTKGDLELIAEARGIDATGTKDAITEAVSANQDSTGVNPALVAEPVERKARRYRVTAPTAVYEYPKGAEFERLIPESQEALLLESGAIQRIPQKEGE